MRKESVTTKLKNCPNSLILKQRDMSACPVCSVVLRRFDIFDMLNISRSWSICSEISNLNPLPLLFFSRFFFRNYPDNTYIYNIHFKIDANDLSQICINMCTCDLSIIYIYVYIYNILLDIPRKTWGYANETPMFRSLTPDRF
jgi:hypothetical protein